MNPLAVPYPGDHTLYHYTDKAGYDGIMRSKKIYASHLEGKQHTHYGKGVYFTPVTIRELLLFPCLAIEGIFDRVTEKTVAKMLYCVAVRIDPNWYACQAFDRSEHDPDNVWVVPLEAGQALEIGQHLRPEFSGPTHLLKQTFTSNAEACAQELLAQERARKQREAKEIKFASAENCKGQQANG